MLRSQRRACYACVTEQDWPRPAQKLIEGESWGRHEWCGHVDCMLVGLEALFLLPGALGFISKGEHYHLTTQPGGTRLRLLY